MYIKQLSVFIENREGRLEEVLDVLKQNDVKTGGRKGSPFGKRLFRYADRRAGH